MTAISVGLSEEFEAEIDVDDDGTVRLLGDLACLDRQRLLVDLGVHRVRHTISILQQR